jgi:hypothetical protein
MTPENRGLLHCVAESFVEQLGSLHDLAGPKLRMMIDSHDFPFSTLNAVEGYGKMLLKVVTVLRETATQLKEAMKDDSPKELTLRVK